jgi:hypothetical protein
MLFKVVVSLIDRSNRPSGAIIGFSYNVQAESAEQAEAMATARTNQLHQPGLYFIESVKDVTPTVSRY